MLRRVMPALGGVPVPAARASGDSSTLAMLRVVMVAGDAPVPGGEDGEPLAPAAPGDNNPVPPAGGRGLSVSDGRGWLLWLRSSAVVGRCGEFVPPKRPPRSGMGGMSRAIATVGVGAAT